MKCPFCIKVCTKCGKLLVVYSGNFKKAKKGKYGFASQCKKCDKQYYEENKEEILEKQKEYYEENKEEILERNKQYNEEHKEEILEYMKQYYKEHKEELKEKKKQYYEEHKEEIAEKNKQYREEHKEELKEKNKQYREEHKEQIAEYQKRYYKENPHVKFNSSSKRRQLEENQGRGITKEQWYEMMNFFDWKCAYSGKYIGGDSEFRTIDHIDCLDNGGLHEIWNLIPMYANYNFSKNATKDMLDWYKKQPFFSEERLNKIYEWVEYAWNKWGYETESEIVFNYCDLNDETIERYFEELEEVI